MRLHEQVTLLRDHKETTNAGINSIRSYLNSDKFGADIMVNKNDVLLRLRELTNDLDSIESDLNS